MAEKKKGLGLPQTRGSFQIRGVVTGTQKENFYTEKLTKTDKPWRSVAFGLKYDKDATMFVSLNGMEKENVFFTKKEDKETITKEVPWRDRFTFAEKDFSLIDFDRYQIDNWDGADLDLMSQFNSADSVLEEMWDALGVDTAFETIMRWESSMSKKAESSENEVNDN
jgi:hypothetical protein